MKVRGLGYYTRVIIGVREGLEIKWWHRLLKVILIFSALLLFVFSFLIFSTSVKPTKFTARITSNLKEFTKASSNDIINTVPAFLALPGDSGCLNEKTKEIDWLSEYEVERGAFCNTNLDAHLSEVLTWMNKNKEYGDRDTTLKELIDYTKDHTGACLIKTNLNCDNSTSGGMIKYYKDIFYYLQISIYSIITVSIWILLWSIFYYRVLIYIFYGNKKQ